MEQIFIHCCCDIFFIILFPQLPAQHQIGYVQYFLALVLAGRARFLAPCWGRGRCPVGQFPAAAPQYNASPAS